MKELEYDKTRWAPGPWFDEPDRLQFKTATGLPGLIVRNRFGALCGYVAVESSHPFYGKDYDSLDVDIHGGLTYADKCMEDGPICHVPELDEPDDVWWFGFDCAHTGDQIPGIGGYSEFPEWETYKNVDYVRAEVESLAQQLVSVTT